MGKRLSREQEKAMFSKMNQGKEYRKTYNSDPGILTKSQIHSDVRHMHGNDDPREPQDHSREYDNYRRKLQYESDKQYLREKKKSTKKQKRILKKEDKTTKKQQKEMAKNVKQGYKEDQAEESETREEIKSVEGN